jgi:type IV pilus assembly protein PilQ
MIFRNRNRFMFGILLLCVTVVLSACAHPPGPQKSSDAAPVRRIVGIETEDDSERFHVSIKASDLLTYTAVKHPSPPAVILYFPDTVLDTPQEFYRVAGETVSAIALSKVDADTPTSRVEISLIKDAPYEVTRNGSDFKISFRKAALPASTPAENERPVQPAKPPLPLSGKSGEWGGRAADRPENQTGQRDENLPAARVIKGVTAKNLENGIEISVTADGTIRNFHSFTIDKPARIIFDLFELKSPQKGEQQVPVQTPLLRSVRYFAYPDRLRILLDTHQEFLSAFSAVPAEDGLRIRMTAGARQSQFPVRKSAEKTPKPLSTAKRSASEEEKILSEAEPPTPAWVNRIDFTAEPDGKSSITIGTTRPVKFDLKEDGENRLRLSLFNARFSENKRRPLITTRFQSAVDRIVPYPTANSENTALVSIELREAIPYLIEQDESLLKIRFESSTVPPRTGAAADLPKREKEPAAAGPVEAPEVLTPEPAAGSIRAAAALDEGAAPPAMPLSRRTYNGQKIALDFYETDIKNVFRILKEVSGNNFAVDPNVTGKVTISLEKPVPWDAVLDLVLRMNQLGMVEEAGIMRIARQDTIRTEMEAKRAETAAAVQAKEQIKALEPLVTRYIPVNYANAEADVLPHIVMTPERGKVSVDARNNQLIITDTEEMVERAVETVRKIDQVTPQVLIEARVVEAASSFSRELGAQLSVQITDIFTKELGNGIIPEGKVDLDMSATNPPTQALGQIGFDFTKLSGTPLKISATLLAAESEGQIKIVSSPKVLTLDNRTARIKQGTQVPIPRLDDSGNTVIEYKDVDLQLEVTPHVTPDRRIAMEIKITNNEIGQEINNQTSFTTKEATTELLVSDGETIVIGGIRKTKRQENESGVPGLMKVPVLGWLFKSQDRSEELQELLIFITPRIVQLEQRLKS